MLVQSDELEVPKEELRTSIEAAKEPFMALYHNGSTSDSTGAFALQFEISINSWTLRVGEIAANNTDFLTAYNQVTVAFTQYEDLSVTDFADGIFNTLTSLLSGRIQILASKYASGGIYGTELLISSDASEQSIDTSWFGSKNVEQPATTTLLKNTILAKSQDSKPQFLLTTDLDNEPMWRGRVFTQGNYIALTYTEYKSYAPKQKADPRKTLGILFAGIVALYIGITLTQTFFPNSVWPFVVLVVLFIILIGTLAKTFPYLLLIALGPMLAGFVAFGVFAAMGSGLYYLVPQINEAVNSHNIPLSMAIVLGWAVIGLIIGIITFVKVEKKLQAVAIAKTDILK